MSYARASPAVAASNGKIYAIGDTTYKNTSAPANPSILTSKFGAGYSKYCVFFIFYLEFDRHSLF